MQSSSYTRRSFLGRLGIGAATVAGSSGAGALLAPGAHGARSRVVATSPQTFGRLFPSLPPFASATDAVRAALLALGAKGGPLDANDELSAGPVRLITDPTVNGNSPPTNPDNPTHTAGTHFFGQFVDHDITFDTSSQLGVPTDPATSPNGRSPSLDLDSVYGAGPITTAQLYERGDRAKLKIESGGLFEDLPRAEDATAIVSDPRNDETLIIAGLQCATILFHNHTVDHLRETTKTADGWPVAFELARRLTRWHYQWLVVHEFLPLFVGQATVDDVLHNGSRFFTPQMGRAFMPVEFAGAAYRFGHSMVRPSYRANLKGAGGNPFFGLVFDGNDYAPGADPADLRGGFRAPRRFIGWQTFYDFGDGNVKPNKRIDAKISSPLFDIPLAAIASHDQPQVLPQRNLLRQLTWSLPSGQSVAAAMGETQLAAADLADFQPYGFDRSTPLWLYVLKEAGVTADGLHLGPVGGRIVAEVLVGLLRADPTSYLALEPGWTPTFGSGGMFRMVDFLTFAGVDPTSRHAQQPAYA